MDPTILDGPILVLFAIVAPLALIGSVIVTLIEGAAKRKPEDNVSRLKTVNFEIGFNRETIRRRLGCAGFEGEVELARREIEKLTAEQATLVQCLSAAATA